jgi:hypothetical protein
MTRREGLAQPPSSRTSKVPTLGRRSFASLSGTTGQKYGIFKTAAVIQENLDVDEEKKSSGRSSPGNSDESIGRAES